MTKSSIWFQSEPLLLAVKRLANRSRTTCDFDMLRARASLAISAKRPSGILRVIVLTEARYYISGRMAIPRLVNTFNTSNDAVKILRKTRCPPGRRRGRVRDLAAHLAHAFLVRKEGPFQATTGHGRTTPAIALAIGNAAGVGGYSGYLGALSINPAASGR